MDQSKVSPAQMRALKIVAYLNRYDKPITVAETFGFMQGGVRISISDLLLTVENLRKGGFLTVDINRLRLTENGKTLAKKLPAALGR